MTDFTQSTPAATPSDPFADLQGLEWGWPDEPIRVTRTARTQQERRLGDAVEPLDPPAFAVTRR